MTTISLLGLGYLISKGPGVRQLEASAAKRWRGEAEERGSQHGAVSSAGYRLARLFAIGRLIVSQEVSFRASAEHCEYRPICAAFMRWFSLFLVAVLRLRKARAGCRSRSPAGDPRGFFSLERANLAARRLNNERFATCIAARRQPSPR